MIFIEYLNGIKTVIGGIACLTVGFLQNKLYIDGDTAMYLLSLSGLILGIGVSHKVLKKEENGN